MAFELQVNGETYSVEVPPDTPLLWVLREELELKGTKFGCGMGLCGACTVHLDGAAIRSCITPVSAASQGQITTIEGLGKLDPESEGLHPLQKSWIEESAPQCGYCQSGQIMAAAALLNENPRPDAMQIREQMSGNICRCGSYSAIARAIEKTISRSGAAKGKSQEKGVQP